MSFFFLGSSPFLNIPPTIPLKLVGLMCLGFGTGSVLVASYSCALNAALQMPAYPEDIKTYSLVSSLWRQHLPSVASSAPASPVYSLTTSAGHGVQGLISITLVLSLVAVLESTNLKTDKRRLLKIDQVTIL